VNSIFAPWISAYLIYGDLCGLLINLFASFKYIFLVLFSYYKTHEKKSKVGTNLTQLKYDL